MNNKGQTLVIFLILIPIIIVILALVIDLGLVQSTKTKMLKVTEMIIEDVIDKEGYDKEELVKRLYKENKIKYTSLKVTFDDNKLSINIIKNIEGLFGKFISLNNYKIEISLTGYRQNDKIIIEKG